MEGGAEHANHRAMITYVSRSLVVSWLYIRRNYERFRGLGFMIPSTF